MSKIFRKNKTRHINKRKGGKNKKYKKRCTKCRIKTGGMDPNTSPVRIIGTDIPYVPNSDEIEAVARSLLKYPPTPACDSDIDMTKALGDMPESVIKEICEENENRSIYVESPEMLKLRYLAIFALNRGDIPEFMRLANIIDLRTSPYILRVGDRGYGEYEHVLALNLLNSLRRDPLCNF